MDDDDDLRTGEVKHRGERGEEMERLVPPGPPVQGYTQSSYESSLAKVP